MINSRRLLYASMLTSVGVIGVVLLCLHVLVDSLYLVGGVCRMMITDNNSLFSVQET